MKKNEYFDLKTFKFVTTFNKKKCPFLSWTTYSRNRVDLGPHRAGTVCI